MYPVQISDGLFLAVSTISISILFIVEAFSIYHTVALASTLSILSHSMLNGLIIEYMRQLPYEKSYLRNPYHL